MLVHTAVHLDKGHEYLSAYGFPSLIAHDKRAHPERTALVELGGGFDPADVAAFATCFGLPAPHVKAIPIGSAQTLPPLNETELDLEVLTAAAPVASSIDVYEAAKPSGLVVLKTFGAPLFARSQRPNVESISYGLCERKAELKAYRLLDDEFEFEAAAGITVVASAGDTGSSGCAINGNSSALPVRRVQFPASSPYVTGV